MDRPRELMASFFRRCGRVLPGLVTGLILCAPLHALPSYLNVDQLYHTQWTARDGAPSGIMSLAQTADGYLWMAAASGLYRFDGVRFEPVSGFGGRQILSKAIYGLKSSPDGGLWIGYALGGASFVKDGRITNYSEPEGLPRSSVSRF